MTRIAFFALLTISGCAAVSPAPAAGLMFPQRGRMAVVDAAHVLSPSDAAALNAKVAAWNNATGHQLAIVTLPTLQGDDIADYGYKLGRAWGLGRKGINDGALLIIAPLEHRVRIEVGRGLEGDLTDAETSEILHDTVVPKLKAGDVVGAANAGADAIMRVVPAGAGEMANALKPNNGGWLSTILMIIGGLGVGAVLVAAWRMLRRMKRAAKEERDPFVAMRQRHDDMRKRVEAEIAAGARPGRRNYTPLRYVSPLPPFTGKTEAQPRPSGTTIIAPVIINEPSYSPSPSYSSDTSSSWGPSDGGSSSSFDFGSSSSGFDSGGGDFGGGGSDSSW